MAHTTGNNIAYIENLISTKPLLVTVEHAGNEIPNDLGNLGLSHEDRLRHISYDIGIKGVAIHLSSLTCYRCIFSRYSRLVVDLNRPQDSPECIRKESDGTKIPGNIGLTHKERAKRLSDYHTPFHELVADTIDHIKPKVLLSLHSFTPKLNEENRTRPWHCGVLYDNSVSLGKRCIEFLQKEDAIVVGDNEPYRIEKDGDYTIPNHGDNRDIPAILIEIRQDLIQEKAGQEKWAKIMISMIENCFKDYL